MVLHGISGGDFNTKEVRKLIAHWALNAWNGIPKEVVMNAWRHGRYSYFPDESTTKTNYSQLFDDSNEGETIEVEQQVPI